MGARDGLRCQRPSTFSFTLLADFLSTTSTDISTFCTVPRRLPSAPSLEAQKAAASEGRPRLPILPTPLRVNFRLFSKPTL